jgi:Desulfoferrodoxin
MEQKTVSRRDFLQSAAVVGATVLTAGSAFQALGKSEPANAKTRIFVCMVCGHVEFGGAPEFCPVCHAPREKFEQNDTVFSDAEGKGKELTVSHTPVLVAKKKSGLISEMPCLEITVRIGKKLHPMEEAHHIRFIDCYVDDKHVSRNMLTLGSYAAGTFQVKATGTKVRVVHVCNLHGHWQAETEAI